MSVSKHIWLKNEEWVLDKWFVINHLLYNYVYIKKDQSARGL